MKKLFASLAALAGCLGMTACTSPEDTSRHALTGMGMTDVSVEYSYLATAIRCSKGDDWGVSFTAKGYTGQPVSGTVCGGYIGKGATVRFD